MTQNYALLDSGEGEKLERFGQITLRRPDPEALWPRALSKKIWDDALLSFARIKSTGGVWKKKGEVTKEWNISHGGFQFLIQPTSFKHVGLFPEQENNWQFIQKKIKGKSVAVLNLFAYTGGATIAAASAGAEVTHVDASKPVVDWARKNAKLNGLEDTPIRWIVDDVLTFVRREVKRGKKYDAIIMDPPAFGHGPKGDLWKIEKDFLPLIAECMQLLSPNPLFFIVSGYASGYSGITFSNNLEQIKSKYGGTVEHLELSIQEETSRKFLLPAGVVGRWSSR